ncbi:MAG: hypothetical protein ACPL7I_06220, partial [Myxococcota bacterium]
GLMYQEIIKTTQSVSLRGGTYGVRTIFLLIRYLPIVLLCRMSSKAVRVSYAMILRRYEDAYILANSNRLSISDFLLLIFSFFWLIIAFIIRIDIL